MTIADRLAGIKAKVPPHVKIIAVTKTQSLPAILEAYQAGHRLFAENRVQEMIEKQPLLPADIEWHFIGHLQTNKVKFIAPFIRLIHSVDRRELLRVIDREAEKHQRVIPCLLQIRIAREATKFGMSAEDALALCHEYCDGHFRNVQVRGLMGMATFTEDSEQVRQEFAFLASFFNRLRNDVFHGAETFCELSMGMSGDYELAIREGATMVRLGSVIFGERK